MTSILSLFGLFLAVLSGAMLLPSAIAAASGEYVAAMRYLIGAAFTGFVAGSLIFAFHGVDKRLNRTGVFSVAVLTWFLLPAFASIPFYLSSTFDSFNASYFEAVSGFTTTGATIITQLEEASVAVIVWRAILQWLGGLATILLILLVIAPAKVGGTPDRPLAMIERGARTARQRVRSTAQVFVPLYSGLTFICFGLLTAAGIPLVDSFCLALSTISTGGFMPRDGGLEIYNSRFLEAVLGVFMYIGATSVIWHRLITKSRWQIVRQHREGYWLAAIVIGVGILFAIGFYRGVDGPSGLGIGNTVFKGILTALSLISTTGFEFRQGGFSAVAFPVLLTLVIIGGAGYSTAGGIKLYRIGAMLVQGGRELRRLIYPHGVRPTHFGGQTYDMQVMKSVWSAFISFLIVIAGLTIALGFAELDFEPALLAAISAVMNIGPLYQSMIPGNEGWLTYAEFHPVARISLAFAMIAGRLEILALFALLNMSYWRS